MIKLTIDGLEATVEQGATILDAAKQVGVYIPTLCYLEDINCIGACRMCLVEVEGTKNFQTACTYPATDGLKVRTNSKGVTEARKGNLQLILSNHPQECLTCIRSDSCELQALSKKLNIRSLPFEGEQTNLPTDESGVAIQREPNKCIQCQRCKAICSKVQAANVYTFAGRGFERHLTPAFEKGMSEAACINCGQCIKACPVGALHEKEDTDKAWAALRDPDLHVAVQTAPAIRVALGEEFGLPMGTLVTGKMVAALRRLGFDAVFDTDVAADITIMEEGHEFLARLKKGGPFPHITSCSPGWVKFCEHFYPDFLPNLSTVKSPQAILGTLIKTYYAGKKDLDPKKMVVVSVMPCTAKKFENLRPELTLPDAKDRNVDVTLTTRELARMIKEAGIDFNELPDEDFDPPLGISTGAALIFGVTGGVAEAAIRSIYELTTGKEPDPITFKALRGMKGIKEATIKLNDQDIKVAVIHGTGNALKVLDRVKAGLDFYHLIEVMGCSGGCVAGGGQPIAVKDHKLAGAEERAKAIYRADEIMPLRKSHESPVVKALYQEFLGKPLGDKAHKYLHTHYTERTKH